MDVRIICAAVVILAAGCASSPPTYTYSRSGATTRDVSRDHIECMRDVKGLYPEAEVWGPEWYVKAVQAKTEKKQAEEVAFCMQTKGYVVEEGGSQ